MIDLLLEGHHKESVSSWCWLLADDAQTRNRSQPLYELVGANRRRQTETKSNDECPNGTKQLHGGDLRRPATVGGTFRSVPFHGNPLIE